MSSHDDKEFGWSDVAAIVVGAVIFSPIIIPALAAERSRQTAKEAQNRRLERERSRAALDAARSASSFDSDSDEEDAAEDDESESVRCRCGSTTDLLERDGYYECLSCDNDNNAGCDD